MVPPFSCMKSGLEIPYIVKNTVYLVWSQIQVSVHNFYDIKDILPKFKQIKFIFNEMSWHHGKRWKYTEKINQRHPKYNLLHSKLRKVYLIPVSEPWFPRTSRYFMMFYTKWSNFIRNIFLQGWQFKKSPWYIKYN